MIGLILLYFAGKQFYELAKKHGKHKWGYALLGVASYYIGLFVGAFVIAYLYEMNSPGSIDEGNEMLIGLAGVPVGILTCVLLYKFLAKRLRNEVVVTSDDLLDDIDI
jgi:hypothetical protein